MRGPQALSMVLRKWLTWGNSGQLESDPFTLSHLEMPVRGMTILNGEFQILRGFDKI